MFDSDNAPLERLETEICAHATRLAAATCQWLLMVAAFDRREGWAGWGMQSCAHWLGKPNAITPDWWGDPLNLPAAIDALVTAAGTRDPPAESNPAA